MFTPRARLFILILSAALSILFALSKFYPGLIFTTLLSLIILWGYRKLGTVTLTLSKIDKDQIDDAEKILALTKNPDALNTKQLANYYFAKGYISREKEHYDDAVLYFNKALEIGIPIEHNKAVALLSLADISLIKGNKSNAKSFLEAMKSLKVRQSLMPQVRQMQQYLNM